jgi:hypothetical protein
MCNCKDSFDIRVRCLPIKRNKNNNHSYAKFNKCPSRIDTMCWWMTNEIDLYESFMKNDFSFLTTKFRMSKEDVKEITELIKKEYKLD